MMNFGSVGTIPLPPVDGSFDSGNKLHFLDLYSGIVAGMPRITHLGLYGCPAMAYVFPPVVPVVEVRFIRVRISRAHKIKFRVAV